jgi:phospholipid transport system transporter-binding protein
MSFSPTSITMNDASDALRAGQAAIAQGITVIDLSGLSSFDSSAVSAILAWQRDAARRGIPLQVQGVPAGLHSLAGLYGVEHLLT